MVHFIKKCLLIFCLLVLFGCDSTVSDETNAYVGDDVEKEEPQEAEKKGSRVDLLALNDSRCTDPNCDLSESIKKLHELFPNLEVRNLDYSNSEAKSLYNELELEVLPALLFSKNVLTSPAYLTLERYTQEKGEYRLLRIGANFNPSKEICENGIDDTGNGLIDCADSDCTGTISCREDMANKVDLFVMSQCPFGTQALDAMKEVLDNFKGAIAFDFHFIAQKNPDGTFESLHGQPEIDENIREICVKKNYNENYEYMKYVWCRNKSIQSSEWESCATDNGFDVEKIRTCSEGDEGKNLLSEDIKLAQELQIGASPTWLGNNTKIFHGRTAEMIRSNICSLNEGIEGCENVLSSEVGGNADASCQ